MDQFEFYKVIDGRKVYRGNGRLYSWDELHGEIEVFNKQGWHLGALDAKTGELIHIAGFWLCYIWHINLLSIFYCSIFSFIQILSNYLFYNVFPPPTYAPSSPDTSLMVSFYLHVHTAPISAVLSVLPFPHSLHC